LTINIAPALRNARRASEFLLTRGDTEEVNTNRYYETTVVVNGMLEDDAITQVVDRTAEFITRNGGTIKSADHWGRRRLAYAINKKNNGYYVQFGVEGPGELVPQLERFFHLEEQIIRHLMLQLTERDLKDREDMKNRLIAEAEAEEAAAAEGADDDDDEEDEDRPRRRDR
jgi:small subunit ribosomal protein S6